MAFPFLLLLVSGGHCQLLGVGGLDDFRLYGSTIDDAVGEAFDKTAKLLGLPYPGGPSVEAAAAQGNAKAHTLPRPLLGRPGDGADFSFSGLKTGGSPVGEWRTLDVNAEDVSASFQAAVIAEILADRTAMAMKRFREDFGSGALVVAGGVAANQAIGALPQAAGGLKTDLRSIFRRPGSAQTMRR